MSFSPVASSRDAVYKLIKPLLKKLNTLTLSPADLFFRQMYNGKFCHYDIVVKYMVLQHEFNGRYPDIWNTYRKMQLFGNNDAFADMRIENFRKAIASLRKDGFLHNDTISVDKEFYIRDGSHRTAMALFCGVEKVYTLIRDMPYLIEIKTAEFNNTDFTDAERKEIEDAYLEIYNAVNRPLQIVSQGSKADIRKFSDALSVYGKVSVCEDKKLSVKTVASECGFKAVGRRASAQNISTVISLQLDKISYKKIRPYRSSKITYGKDKEIILSCHDDIAALAAQNSVYALVPHNFLENAAVTNIICK